VKWLNRFIYAWGLAWLILCALVVWDVVGDGDKRLWREAEYGL